MGLASASKSDSDPEWKVDEEDEEHDDDDDDDDDRRTIKNTRPSRSRVLVASASSTVAVAGTKPTMSRRTNKKKNIHSNDRPRGGRERRIKKYNQLFRHKLVLPGSYLALSYPFHAAAASITEADGSAREEDGNTVLWDGDREQWRARRRGERTEKKFGYNEQQIGENGSAAKRIVDNSTRRILQNNHQKMTAAVHGQRDHVHNQKSSGLWDYISDRNSGNHDDNGDDCDELVNITTNTIDIDLIGESDDDNDKRKYQSYCRQKRRLPERLEIQSKHIPRSKNVLYWSGTNPSSVSTECNQRGDRSSRVTNEDEKVTTETEITTSSLNNLHSLQRRIERADALIQSMAPSFIEFRAKRWADRSSFAKDNNNGLSTAAASSTSIKHALQSETLGRRVDVPAEYAMIIPSRNTEDCDNVITGANDNINPLVDYQTQQSFFTLAPCLRSYATTESAHEFLVLLQNAAVEASAKAPIALTSEEHKSTRSECSQNCFREDDGNGQTWGLKTDSSTISTSAFEVIVEFLSIIAESRLKPHAPFYLMKKIWVLILAVASRCNDGTLVAQNLASKFDSFLPEGYSMMSSNLLFMQSDGNDCTSLHVYQREEIETLGIPSDEPCARVKSMRQALLLHKSH